ncbi:hypothetical protein [Neptunicoccus cionae]|uniref:Membrane protein n=1 Tax=Neptunicoccus cionae TaxID=2035344 RepID=A0A916VLS6_9RHOB|nr:hypothetical protein [Amylibacter cionae]GGA06765.1 membrane protein [Amylibacter cionae]
MNMQILDYEIAFTPLIPQQLLLILALIALAFTTLALWRRLPGWALRGLALCLVLGALAQPVIRQEDREYLSNIVFVVVDKTESQSVDIRPEQIAQGVAALRAEIGTLEGFETRLVEVENDPGVADDGSMMLGALAKAASEVATNRIAGALLVTDGQIHDAPALDSFPAPVHVLLTGQKTDWDRRLVITNAPAFAIVGEPVTLQLRVEDQGAVPAAVQGMAHLSISVDGGPAQEFDVETGRQFELPLTLPHGGANVLQFTVRTEAGELTDRNNAAVLSINGVRDRLRVLLVSGEPHAGERTWRNLLKSDSAVDLVHFTILRSPDKQDGVPVRELSLIAFPTRELFLEKIDEFDLIIFDRYRRRGILPNRYMQNVADYVRRGGAVLVASGPAFGGTESIARTPLNSILPAAPTARVIEKGFVPRISDLGQRHPVTESLDDFAPRPVAEDGTPGWGRWLRLIETVAPEGQTVMTGADDKPLLVLDRVDEGRIAMLMSDHAWLWSRGFEGGGPQLELLRRLAHWTMKEPELEEERLSGTVEGDAITVTRRSLTQEQADITVTGPDGSARPLETSEVSPGRWVGRFKGEENGLYRLSDGDMEAVVAIGPTAPREFEQTMADLSRLQPVMAATGGGSLRLEDYATPQLRQVREGRTAAGRGWLGVTPRNAYIATDIRQTPALPAWLLLVLVAGVMVAAWRWEGR